MINVIRDGYCEGCDAMELEVADIPEGINANGEKVYSQDICCVHEYACNRMFWLFGPGGNSNDSNAACN